MRCGNDESRTLTVANSGLPRPIFVHGGKNEVIEATGLPLGLFDEADYDEFTFRMKPGDMFVFFSDGILDARNRQGNSSGADESKRLLPNVPVSLQTAWWNRCSRPPPSIRPEWRRLTIRLS
jgi:sigma-B regulation protein RsbU (phosphoserine phosphatase)